MEDFQIRTDFEDSKEEFIKFITAIEYKFEIKKKDEFEDEILKLIREGVDVYNKSAIDIDAFENSFFDIIYKYSTIDFEENIDRIQSELERLKEMKENG